MVPFGTNYKEHTFCAGMNPDLAYKRSDIMGLKLKMLWADTKTRRMFTAVHAVIPQGRSIQR